MLQQLQRHVGAVDSCAPSRNQQQCCDTLSAHLPLAWGAAGQQLPQGVRMALLGGRNQGSPAVLAEGAAGVGLQPQEALDGSEVYGSMDSALKLLVQLVFLLSFLKVIDFQKGERSPGQTKEKTEWNTKAHGLLLSSQTVNAQQAVDSPGVWKTGHVTSPLKLHEWTNAHQYTKRPNIVRPSCLTLFNQNWVTLFYDVAL